jgi:CobQ-like glutamine amidotransferase family enzyme
MNKQRKKERKKEEEEEDNIMCGRTHGPSLDDNKQLANAFSSLEHHQM